MSSNPKTTITVIGTGRMGSALAARLANADYRVYLGSRNVQKAKEVAADVNQRVNKDLVSGAANFDAVGFADMCILAVPFEAQKEILNPLKMMLYRKTLVTTAAALDPKNLTTVSFGSPGSSAGVEAQKLVGEKVKVVSAFQTIMYRNLLDLSAPVPCDTFVAGNNQGAKQNVIELAASIGIKAWDIGPIENTFATEAFTSAIMYLSKTHDGKLAGLRATGLD